MKENLPIRKRIRLKEYDYSEEGYYFITILHIFQVIIAYLHKKIMLKKIENSAII